MQKLMNENYQWFPLDCLLNFHRVKRLVRLSPNQNCLDLLRGAIEKSQFLQLNNEGFKVRPKFQVSIVNYKAHAVSLRCCGYQPSIDMLSDHFGLYGKVLRVCIWPSVHRQSYSAKIEFATREGALRATRQGIPNGAVWLQNGK
jgi:hypothetical protein